MNKIKISILLICALIFLAGCDKSDFQKLNTDDELLGTTDPRSAFTGAVNNFNNNSRTHLMAKYSGVMQMMQYLVFYGGATSNIYVSANSTKRPSPYTPYYSDYYGNIGLYLDFLINKLVPASQNPEKYKNIVAISKILKNYEAWLMFDVNGAAPFVEALKNSNGIKLPRYDLLQKDINGKELYKTFDNEIKENVKELETNKDQIGLGSNDFFYGGDIQKWIKFGNTLRVKMAQRFEKVDNQHYKTVIGEVLGANANIISNNNESCVYHHGNDYGNNTDDVHILTYQYSPSRAFVQFLQTYNDPRLPILVRRNGFGSGNNNKINDDYFKNLEKIYPDWATKYKQWTGRYVGMAANPDSANSDWYKSTYYDIKYKDSVGNEKVLSIRHISQIESRFYVKNGGNIGTQITARDKEDEIYSVKTEEISLFTPIITYPEVCFMLAEIALKENKAMAGKDALTWFRDGIRASMEEYQIWGEKMKVPSAMDKNSANYNPITSEKIEKYLDQTEFKTVSLEKIISQQWINLFMRPEEAWATWKRTGLPAFKANPTPENGVAYFENITSGSNKLIIPRRCALPVPNSENMENYKNALKQLMEDPNYGADESHTEGRIWWDKP